MKKKITNKQLAMSLFEVTKGLSGGEQKKAIDAFVKLLAKKNKLKKIGFVISEFEKYSKKQEGITEIEITAARELDDKVISSIKKAFGGKVEATFNVDSGLLGGIRIKTEDKIFDASIKAQLIKLKQELI